jgi:bacillithiol biosynthesis cysteine-adding enzyme BshC
VSETIVVTESLGGSPLSRAGRAGELPDWFVPRPGTPADWKAHARRVIESVDAKWLDSLAPAIAASGAAANRIGRSANGAGLVVTTGQQPGLFGGPLMTLAKAITARALADVLQETTGVPVAPVFWAATDDADFDETATVSLSLDGGARALKLDRRAAPGTPVTRVPMGGDLNAMIDCLCEACGSAAHASYLEAALAAYREGATIGDSYVELLRAVLEPLEIAVLDASHPAVTAASAGVMDRAAKRAKEVADAVRQRDESIKAAGFRAQVEDVPGLSLVFVNENGTKRRLTQAEALQFAPSDDRWLSSTVLLRPVTERAILPTATYIGGPGEVAYFAQVTVVADALDLPRPMVVPRWSTTVLEPRIQKMLDTLGASAAEFADPHAVESRLAREAIDKQLAGALTALQATTGEAVARVADAGKGVVDPRVLDGVRRDIAHRIERLERRVTAAVKRRESELMRRIATVRGALYPHGIRQERKLAWLPFLVRGGPPLLAAMLDAARIHAQSLVTRAPSLAAAAKPPTARV